MNEYEYMTIPLSSLPQHTVVQYDLNKHAQNGQVYLKMWRAIYGLPQAGALANNQLKNFLAPTGYYTFAHTPGIWRHTTRLIQFSLVVDYFGVKYVGKYHWGHLLRSLRKHYASVTEDREGTLYCGITLEWNYAKCWVDILMPGYIKKLRQRYQHDAPKKPQHIPYRAQPKIYGAAAQDSIPTDDSPTVEDEQKKRVQQFIAGVLYYRRSADLTVLPAISSIASEQTSATGSIDKKCAQLLDYLATHVNPKIQYYASYMVLNIHSDASYLSETQTRSRVAGQLFLGKNM